MQLLNWWLQRDCAPLAGHCFGNAFKRAASFLPSVWGWGHHVNPWLASFDNISGLEARQVVEPQACGFHLAMAKLPRLNDLIRWPDG